MPDYEALLKNDERAVFALRKLYSDNGYKKFKMSKFEEYDLYVKNKDFLVSEGVITFNDTNGKLLALKPDVTLSILKNYSGEKGNVEKYYYNENVYRVSESSHTYKEIMQSGLECIGDLSESDCLDVIGLAFDSLALINDDFIINLSHKGLLEAVLDDYFVEKQSRKEIINAIMSKNSGLLSTVTTAEQFAALDVLIEEECSLEKIEKIVKSENSRNALEELKRVCEFVESKGFGEKYAIDFSLVSANGYYSGIIFKGYIHGITDRVLSGGRYDKLLRNMGRNAGAIGFAVYLDTLERMDDIKEKDDYINIALPKGRLGEKVYAMFEKAGLPCPSIKENNRKLIFENEEKKVRYFWVKPSDVAIYVERGAADIGVARKDILLEYEPDVYELLDLKLGKCRMAVAAKDDFCDDTSKTLRVATKFSNIAKKYYNDKCRDIDIIHLNGSIEIAPILNLSDVIVDIVETGKTLLENNLRPYETIVDISARMISNKSSYSFKQARIEEIKKAIGKEVEKDND